MRRKLESYVEHKVSAWCVEHGILTLKFTPDGQRGWPDRIFIRDGRVAFIEFKADGEEPRPLQMHRMQMLRDANIPVIWTNHFEEAIKFLHGTLITTSEPPLSVPDYSSIPASEKPPSV
jgi:hypothetical protein